MARKFLYIMAVLIVLVMGVLFALRFWSEDLTEYTFVPQRPFETQPALKTDAYADPALWFVRPGAPGVTAWRPEGAPKPAPLPAAVFFVHPTSYLAKAHWTGPLDDAEQRERAELFLRAMATPFSGSPQLWAPRYRQAAFGAFLTDKPEANQALELAYSDVLAAFDRFAASIPHGMPIVLAGHSQGAFHLKRLLKERIAGTPLVRRIAAVYLVGWPVSQEHDLPAIGLPACERSEQAGCVMSWLSFAEPADTGMMTKGYARRTALDGKSPQGSAFLCSNPLTGGMGGAAPAAANLGTLKPAKDGKSANLVPAMVPARCGKDGFLDIGPGPDLGPYVLPGNNYHVYDIPLFWANLRADVSSRVTAWKP